MSRAQEAGRRFRSWGEEAPRDHGPREAEVPLRREAQGPQDPGSGSWLHRGCGLGPTACPEAASRSGSRSGCERREPGERPVRKACTALRLDQCQPEPPPLVRRGSAGARPTFRPPKPRPETPPRAPLRGRPAPEPHPPWPKRRTRRRRPRPRHGAPPRTLQDRAPRRLWPMYPRPPGCTPKRKPG